MFVESDEWKKSDPANGFINYAAVRRTIHKNMERIRVLSKPVPKIEKVSTDEIYLIGDNGERIRRICGSSKKYLPPEYVCELPAGAKTTHLKFGRCIYHDSRRNGQEQYTYRKLLEEVSEKSNDPTIVARTLLDFERAFPDVELRMDDLSQELRTLYSVLRYAINRPDTQFGTKSFIQAVNELIANVIKLKKTQKDIDLANNYIALTDLNRFLDQLIAVVSEICGRTKASEVFSRVKETIVIGYNSQAFDKLSMSSNQDKDIQEAEVI